MANSKTKVVTGVVRLSYANVWEPKAVSEGQTPKYSVSIIIPKEDKDTLAKINAAIDAAIEEGIGKFGGKKPNKATLKLPLRDGDVERDCGCKSAAHSGTRRSLQRCICESFHQFLCFQQQRQQRNRVRSR